MHRIKGPRSRTSIFSHCCSSFCASISICKCIGGGGESSEVSVQWPGISSPCSHPQYRNVSCQPPRRRRGGGLLSAPSCSHSGPLRLNWVKDENKTSFQQGEKWRQRRKHDEMGGAEKRAKGADSWSTSNYEPRHMRGQWEEMLTFLLQCSKLSWIDHSAGDLQLDAFRFQTLKPG